jgi:starch-binding outer membrane protein, SusD/RagB family
MKKIVGYILLMICLGCISCKKFLTQEPYNNLSITDVFKDLEGARTSLAGCYENLRSSEYYLRSFSVYSEVTGGNIKYSRTANLALDLSYNFLNNIIENDMNGFYKKAYSIIYNANTIIANVDNITDANIFQKNKMLADAYCIRALVHFDLTRVFGQAYNFTNDASHQCITIKNSVSTILSPILPLNTCKQVYDQINSDLEKAISLYPNAVKIFTTGDDKTYFSLDAAKALQSRVALYKNDWSKTISLTTDIINSTRYSLISNSNYVGSWRQKNTPTISTESIFELAFGNRIAGSLGDYYNAKSATYGQLASTNDLINLFSIGDVRAKASMFVDTTISAKLYSFSKKYQGMNDSANNIKIIRLSELYLNRAEANAELNNLTAALADLNLIRKRGLPTATTFTSTDKQMVLDEIFIERQRELCFEGHAFFDYSRKQKNIVRVDCIGTNCSFTYPNAKYACPIPNN